jgi:hypothetical protein
MNLKETTMTATTDHLAGNASPTGARLERRALAVLMPIGPLAIAIVRAILPYNTTDSNATVAAKVSEHQGVEGIVIWLTFIALLTLVPGVTALGMLARRGARRLGNTGLALAFAGFMCLFWSTVAASDNVALGAARIGMSPALTGRLLDSIGAIPAIRLASILFVLGHVVGLTLLGVAIWRGRVLPAWAALMIAVSQPLHVVFAVVAPVHALDGLAWGLTTVGFAAAALVLVRESGSRETEGRD